MTNSQDQSASGDQPKSESAPQKPQQTDIDAIVLDVAGQGLSRGTANLYPEDNSATFRSSDGATLDILRKHAKTLLLTESRQSLGIEDVQPCPAPAPGGFVHFHLKLS